MSGLHYMFDTNLLSQPCSHAVDTHGKGLLQRDVGTRETTVGIGGCPGDLLAMIHHLHREIFIRAGVARCDALVHRLGIDKELEGRTWLAHGCHLVVFPCLEVYIAYPSLDVTRLGLDGYKATMHEMFHITDGVHGRHLSHDSSLVVVEQFNLMG